MGSVFQCCFGFPMVFRFPMVFCFELNGGHFVQWLGFEWSGPNLRLQLSLTDHSKTKPLKSKLLNICYSNLRYSIPHCIILTAQQVEKLHRLNDLQSKIDSLASVVEGGSGAQFRAELERLFKYQQLKEDLVQAEYMNSEASLKQLPDYHMRVKVRNPQTL